MAPLEWGSAGPKGLTNLLILIGVTQLTGGSADPNGATKSPGPIGVTPLEGGIRCPRRRDQFADLHREGALRNPSQ